MTVWAVMVGIACFILVMMAANLLLAAALGVFTRPRRSPHGKSSKQVEHEWRKAMTGEPR